MFGPRLTRMNATDTRAKLSGRCGEKVSIYARGELSRQMNRKIGKIGKVVWFFPFFPSFLFRLWCLVGAVLHETIRGLGTGHRLACFVRCDLNLTHAANL